MIKAVIFNFDGVIVDTEMMHYSAWREFTRRNGGDMTIDHWQESAGGSLQKIAEFVKGRMNLQKSIEEITKEKTEIFEKMMTAVSARPGLNELLAELKQLQIKIAIASMNGKDYVTRMLEIMKIEHHFDYIADIANLPPLPAPDLFNKTASILAFEPFACLVIENTAIGVQGASAAGMLCYAITTRFNENEDFSDARHVITSLEEVLPQMKKDMLIKTPE